MSIITIDIIKKNIPFFDDLVDIEKKYNCNIYIVGGFVRDLLFNESSCDIDIVGENIDYIRLSKLLGKSIKAYPIAFKDNMRIVKNNMVIDISKLRGKNIHEDILKRDFTINNLACNLKGEIIGNIDDINNKIIKIVYDNAFDDDPLRIIRAFRFSATLGFVIDNNTLDLATKKSHLLKNVARERVLEEFRKIFQGKYFKEAIECITTCNILNYAIDNNKLDNDKLIQAINSTHNFALLLCLWVKDIDFINYLGLTVKENKEIKRYLSIDYNKLKIMSEKNLKLFIFDNKDLIENIIIYIRINFNGNTLADKLDIFYKKLDFKKANIVDGKLLLSLGLKSSAIFSKIIHDVSFKLALGELDKDNMASYIKNRWEI